MRKRPFLYAAGAVAAGILLAPALWPCRSFLGLLAAAAGIAIAAWYWWRRELPPVPAAFFLVLAGALLLRPPLPQDTAVMVTGVRGWADGEVLPRRDRTYIGLRVATWRLRNGLWQKTGVPLKVWLNSTEKIEYGAWVEARGRLIAAPSAGADGYFFPKAVTPLPARTGSPWRRAALAVREAAERSYALHLGPDEKALLAGLVFGDLPNLSPEILGWFRDAGGVHLLSVSGLHVGFVIAFGLGLAALAGWRGRRGMILAAALTLAYMALCGPKPPILRAAVMGLVAGLGAVRRRRADPGNMLGLAALVVLAWQPRSLWTISGQLSFAAAGGLIFLYPRWAAWLPPARLRWARPILISIVAWLGTLPILAGHFGRVSLVGPLANLVLVPLAGVAVPLGLGAGLLGAIHPFLAGPLLLPLGLLLRLMLIAAGFCARLPWAAVNLGAWGWPAILAFYALLGTVAFGMERNLLNRRPRLALGWLAVILATAMAGCVWWRACSVPGHLSVTFLDVNQGDSVFIRAPGGFTALVDGGEAEEAQGVLSFLRRQGVNRLDLVVVSHPHSDHVGGLTGVIQELPVGRVLDPGWSHTSETYKRFLLALRERNIPWTRARRGLTFTLGREVTGTVLYPQVDAPDPENLNDGSLVIMLRCGQQSLLLPGDLEAGGEEELIGLGDDLRAAVLKAGHHGGATSTSRAWLGAVRPRVAVISAGRNNPFGHPHPETLARLEAAGVTIHRTDADGDITWMTDGRRSRIETER